MLALFAACTPAEATYPGKNGRLAFISYTGSQFGWDVFSMNSDGTDQVNLSHSPGLDLGPDWSPDGQRIAFTSPRPELQIQFEIYAMKSDGTNPVNLTNVPDIPDVDPSWSPDGRWIVFSSDRDSVTGLRAYDFDLWIMRSDGSDQRALTENLEPNVQHVQADWSPTGDVIAFASGLDGAREIELINVGTGARTRLTNNTYEDEQPSWSPDGQRIAFTSDRTGDTEIYVMNRDGSGITRLTTRPGPDVFPVWSPDGRGIAFASDAERDIYVMNPDGSDLRNVTNSLGATHTQPDWQPILNRLPDCSQVRTTPELLPVPNNRLASVSLTGATDPDGDPVTTSVDEVTQDEPIGNEADAKPGTAPDRILLRAQRDGSGDGRVYRVAFTASDGRGGACSGTATVAVPHDRSSTAVDSAPPSYNSFGF